MLYSDIVTLVLKYDDHKSRVLYMSLFKCLAVILKSIDIYIYIQYQRFIY